MNQSTPGRLPGWADELRRRYIRGEASQFVLHGNVHDVILDDPDGVPGKGDDERLLSLSEFLFRVLLDKKTSIALYNVSTGVRFVKGKIPQGCEDLVLHKDPQHVLPLLERALTTQPGMAVVMEYAEAIAPAGETSFSTTDDRAAVVTLQRWSNLPAIDRNDNVVLMLVENLSELHGKLVANPRVATVRVPMPDKDERAALLLHLNPQMPKADAEMYAEITAGLKSIQIKGILSPAKTTDESKERNDRLHYITELLGGGPEALLRAGKLAQITAGMQKEEIRRLIAPDGPAPGPGQGARSADDREATLRLIAARKREIIERECYGLIEFVEPKHGFDVVGGLEAVKQDLLQVAKNIREGRRSRVPMGMLFTGPMGTGKTFVAEAFAKESGLTTIKLKNFRSKWVGATEGNLERILQVVQAIGQVMVIIDEGDRAFGNQGEDDGGTGSRVIGRLKEFMSDTNNRGRVLFVLMTNRPDKLDVDIKRAGRLDRKIPFLYPQSAEEVETIVLAQFKKNRVLSEVRFPEEREELAGIVGSSNADIEAIVLLASDYASERVPEAAVTLLDLRRAMHDYLPSRDTEMLEYMELLAVFEASNRRMLPKKYAEVKVEELQARLQDLRLRVGNRR